MKEQGPGQAGTVGMCVRECVYYYVSRAEGRNAKDRVQGLLRGGRLPGTR